MEPMGGAKCGMEPFLAFPEGSPGGKVGSNGSFRSLGNGTINSADFRVDHHEW